MAVTDSNLVTDVIEAAARPVEGGVHDYDPLLKLIGEARFCLLGEATHGTYEFIASALRSPSFPIPGVTRVS